MVDLDHSDFFSYSNSSNIRQSSSDETVFADQRSTYETVESFIAEYGKEMPEDAPSSGNLQVTALPEDNFANANAVVSYADEEINLGTVSWSGLKQTLTENDIRTKEV